MYLTIITENGCCYDILIEKYLLHSSKCCEEIGCNY